MTVGGAKNGDVWKETTSLAAGDSIKDQRDANESAGEKVNENLRASSNHG